MMKELISPIVKAYLDGLVPARHAELQAMETFATENKFPIIGPVCGYFCYQIARMIGANQIFEMGSGFGYSTAWFAQAVQENGGGRVHHVVWDESLSRQARMHLGRLGLDSLVEFHVGEAIQILSTMEGPFDMVFNDIDKEGYPSSLPEIEEKLKPGGVLIIDNILWSGRIFDNKDRSSSTEAIRDFTHKITTSQNWIASLIPIRDGLIVGFKK